MELGPLPFSKKKIAPNHFIRKFLASSAEKMVWHQDPEDRTIKLLAGSGWLLQMDNELPIKLVRGEFYNIPQFVWHRLIATSGATDIEIEVIKKPA